MSRNEPTSTQPQRPAHPVDWSSGICGCMSDCSSCLDILCCTPCMLSRQCNATSGLSNNCSLGYCLVASCFPTIVGWSIRSNVVNKYNIDEWCLTTICCACLLFPGCSWCQTHRELSARGEWPGGSCCHSAPPVTQPSVK